MKTKTLLICALLITLASCHQNSNTTRGSWTFKNVNYPCTSNIGNAPEHAFISSASTIPADLTFIFIGSQPVTAGTYTVARIPTSGQVQVELDYEGGQFSSVGGNGVSSQPVTVSISNGKLTFRSTSIEMYNTNDATDSANLTVNVNEL